MRKHLTRYYAECNNDGPTDRFCATFTGVFSILFGFVLALLLAIWALFR